jgi:tRNA pseudouridine38-40 synthase
LVRYKAILAYDGTEFAGFQRQSGQRTVQGVVEESLAGLGWTGGSILAAGRTDAGVHALGQVIAFDLDWSHPESDLLQALNARMPSSIAVRSIQQTKDSFHPRYEATARQYRYSIVEDPVRRPFEERFAWRIWPALDLGLMDEGTRCLLGEHDFRAFGSPHKDDRSTVRSIRQAQWTRCEQVLEFEIVGNAFLYHMVRRIVYAISRVGQNDFSAADIGRMLEDGDANRIPGLAPAHGLKLVEVRYE